MRNRQSHRKFRRPHLSRRGVWEAVTVMFTSSRPTFPESDGISTELAAGSNSSVVKFKWELATKRFWSAHSDCECKKRSLFCEKREQRTEIAHVRSFLSIHESNQTICLLLLSRITVSDQLEQHAPARLRPNGEVLRLDFGRRLIERLCEAFGRRNKCP